MLSFLFYKNRSLLGKENDESLEKLAEYLPLKIHKFKSGTDCFDWTVPKEWIVKKAQLKTLNGDVIIDATNSILHLINYSNSYQGIVSNEELKKHVYTLENLPDAIPYRASYYSDNWGFCIPYKLLETLTDAEYEVDIQTEFKDSYLSIGEAVIKGESEKEVVLSSYLCHPLQAHDGLSGVVLLAMLFNQLKKKKLKYTYRFFFIPETIGSIALLSQGIIDPKKVEYALVSTCVGYGEVHYKKTFESNHLLDCVVLDYLKTLENPHTILSFEPTGSDERQFSSPSIRIPTGSIMGEPYHEFEYYHTSLDDLDFVNIDYIEAMADIYKDIILMYESEKKIKSKVSGCEVFLSQYNLYREISVPGHPESSIARNWVLFYADGNHSLKQISHKSGFSEKILKEELSKLLKAKVIEYI
ncbi:peptidase M28 [Candidatus Marinamargulisbacteria bacterium SCGC AG-414-C22]|nr:peptidase M28 [Candidatus Marinamargulisbacteria bacterium SCGC AG-414-C22]